MKRFIKKLSIIVMSLVASASILIVLLITTAVIITSITYISQERICEIVLENQDDLEMIVEDLRSYDMPRVYVNKENITTYINLIHLPDGRYMLGDEGPDFSTSEELRRFIKKLKIQSIKFTSYDELQIVTFEFYHNWMKGFYWGNPDTPTEKAYTSHHDLIPSGDGWEFEDFGDRYYTEKICDNWYYYVVET